VKGSGTRFLEEVPRVSCWDESPGCAYPPVSLAGLRTPGYRSNGWRTPLESYYIPRHPLSVFYSLLWPYLAQSWIRPVVAPVQLYAALLVHEPENELSLPNRAEQLLPPLF
jgi:hypothetical protein